MGLFGKLFGGSFDDQRKEADALFEAGKFGEAKLAYERALDKKKGAPEDDVARCIKRVHACRDAIAKERIAHAEELIAQGARELAEAELEAAMETASDEEIARQAERRIEALDRSEARERVTEQELDPESVYAAAEGNWEEEQLDEYEAYGAPFKDAMLALFAGETKEARTQLEAVLAGAKDARYLHFEVGRAALRDEDKAQAEASLRTFLARIGPDEGGDTRLAAHQILASLADERGDEEAAVNELEAAVSALDDDPRAYAVLGAYLRGKGHAAEAVDVIRAAGEVYIHERPNPALVQELGLALRDAGQDDEAIDVLEHLLQTLVAQNQLDFPAQGTAALATLMEKKGDLRRAADLWRALTRGTDQANHLHYYREAARVLAAAGLGQEARRMLVRASEVARDDAKASAEVAAELAKLEA